MTSDEFFANQPQSKQIFETIRREVESLGESSMRVTESQVAFRGKRGFAWVWMPGMYLKRETPPLVLPCPCPGETGRRAGRKLSNPTPAGSPTTSNCATRPRSTTKSEAG